jgi:mevalonate kinase
MTRTFPAKLLLFGEHVLLQGATALAVPVPRFSGQWVQQTEGERPRQWQQLKDIIERLAAASDLIDVAQLTLDVEMGWHFASNIPEGYGLGSSGALCAALLDRYAVERPVVQDLVALKWDLARLESTFHGQSSGIDPLTSWANQPLIIRNKTEVDLVQPPAWRLGAPAPKVFLLDTQQPRQTGPLVTWFQAQCTDNQLFKDHLQKVWLPVHEAMIAAWLQADTDAFWTHLRQVSAIQYAWMEPMLPQSEALRELWQLGLREPDQHFNVKICGAGGGGFVLGFTEDTGFVEHWVKENGVPIVFPFDV